MVPGCCIAGKLIHHKTTTIYLLYLDQLAMPTEQITIEKCLFVKLAKRKICLLKITKPCKTLLWPNLAKLAKLLTSCKTHIPEKSEALFAKTL